MTTLAQPIEDWVNAPPPEHFNTLTTMMQHAVQPCSRLATTDATAETHHAPLQTQYNQAKYRIDVLTQRGQTTATKHDKEVHVLQLDIHTMKSTPENQQSTITAPSCAVPAAGPRRPMDITNIPMYSRSRTNLPKFIDPLHHKTHGYSTRFPSVQH